MVGFTTGDAPIVGGCMDFNKDQLFIAVLYNNTVKLVIYHCRLMSAGILKYIESVRRIKVTKIECL
ncbi:hypothetical protein CXF95_22020 [Paraglaciecola sp. MB-3u-78]|nr:hypothetical protein CXF95_22020 [Paraglaciecola sp. MB-3u-78]